MPTGYTSTLYNGEQSFHDFVLDCAHAFGACAMLRDEPFTTEIPEFQPHDWNAKELLKARDDLEKFQAMTDADAQIEADAAHEKEQIEYHTRHGEDICRLSRYLKMRKLVTDWTPPTAEHQGLKDFMLQQIETSMSDCTTYCTPGKPLSGAQWRALKIESAQRDIIYHTAENAKEIERTNSRNAWVNALRTSLIPH